MKTLTTILLSISCGFIFAQNACQNIADSLFNEAAQLSQNGKLEKAGELFVLSARQEKSCPDSRLSDIGYEYYNAAQCYSSIQKLDKAYWCYNEALTVYGMLQQTGDAVHCAFEMKLLQEQRGSVNYLSIAKKLDSVAKLNNNQYLVLLTNAFIASDLLRSQRSDSAQVILSKTLTSCKQLIDSIGIEIHAYAQQTLAESFEKQSLIDSAQIHYLKSAELYQQIGKYNQQHDALYHLANMFSVHNACDKAVPLLTSLKNYAQQSNNSSLSLALSGVSTSCLVSAGKYSEAIVEYKKILEAAHASRNRSSIASVNNNMALVYKQMGLYSEAANAYEQAYQLFNQQQETDNAATSLNNMGAMYISLGQYDKAIKLFSSLLNNTQTGKNNKIRIAIKNNIGGVYTSWGQYDEAFQNYQSALQLADSLNEPTEIARIQNNIGGVSELIGNDAQAKLFYTKALESFQQSLNYSGMLSVYNNLAGIEQRSGNTKEALAYYTQSLDLCQKLNQLPTSGVVLDNLGQLNSLLGNTVDAENYFKQAVSIRRQLQERSGLATSLNNLAVLYLGKQNFNEAITLLSEAIQILEELRLTAQGDVRRDYLNSQVDTYQNMIIALLKSKSYERAFYYIELSRAKLLAENIALNNTLQQPSLAQVQAELPVDAVAVIYATVDNREISLMSITQKSVSVDFVQKEQFLKRLLQDDVVKQRVVSGLRIQEVQQLHEFLTANIHLSKNVEKKIFGNTITLYTQLISQLNSKDIAKTKFLGKELYDLLIKPIETTIAGKRTIVVMHEGVLGFLPFETLLDNKRQYLVQTFNISYINSFTVNKLVRSRNYLPTRKPMIAFGVSTYDNASSTPQLTVYRSMDDIKRDCRTAMDSNKNMTNVYNELGFSKFNNLKGSVDEMSTIKTIFAEADTFMNAQVNETHIKSLSNRGSLSQYRIVHFSAHGIAVPEIPELSSLILWRQPQNTNGDEGYLRMKEIAQLRLNSDFTNLSACETALGKVYGGEGIVGLSQAFLIAGTNSMAVSLWQVDESSTATFMRLFYEELQKNNFHYLDAINDIKRRFLLGNEGVVWRQPFFWAPFVYYGF